MPHYKKLVGEKVYLSPISLNDLQTYTTWVNDDEVGQYVGLDSRIISETNEREILEHMAKGGNHFAIIDIETDKIIGGCGYENINELHRTASLGLFIGEKNYWSKGYGTDVMRLLLKFGFEIRNYHNISLYAHSFNPRAIACYEKVGFKRQGVKREVITRGNKKYYSIYMDILAAEYFGK